MSSGVDVTGKRCRSAPSQPRPRAGGPRGADSRRPTAPPSPPPQPQTCSLPARRPGLRASWPMGPTSQRLVGRVRRLSAPQGLLSASQSYPRGRCVLLRNQQSKTCGVGMKRLPTPAPRTTGPQSQVPPLRRGWGLLPACSHPCIYTHTSHIPHILYTTRTLRTAHVHHTPTACVFHKWSTRPPTHSILQRISVILARVSCNLVNQPSVERRLNSK